MYNLTIADGFRFGLGFYLSSGVVILLALLATLIFFALAEHYDKER